MIIITENNSVVKDYFESIKFKVENDSALNRFIFFDYSSDYNYQRFSKYI